MASGIIHIAYLCLAPKNQPERGVGWKFAASHRRQADKVRWPFAIVPSGASIAAEETISL